MIRLTPRGKYVLLGIWLAVVVTFTYLTRNIYVVADWRPGH